MIIWKNCNSIDNNKLWFKNLLKSCGFGRFKWFRQYCGGVWILRCDFYTYINEMNTKPKKYPKQFMTDSFEWILDQEDYRKSP